MKKWIAGILSITMIFSLTACGTSGKKEGSSEEAVSNYKAISGLDTSKEASIKIAIPYETNKALNTVANNFMKKYPNVNVTLQYVDDYDNNALKLFEDNSIDIMFQKDLSYKEYTVTDEATGEETPTGKTTDDYFYNFADDKEIDFSNTTPDISDNFQHTRLDEAGNGITYQYSYPLGGETRGVFVNKTLLDSYGLAIPTNYTEFLDCCKTLKEKGLIPIQGGGDTAAFSLGLAPAANKLVHDEAALERMKNADPTVSEVFKDTLEKIYNLSVNRYVDYKQVEENGYYLVTNELGQAQSFLGLVVDDTTFEVTKPENNYGYAAFMPYISSTETVIQSLIDEYDLDTEFKFICSPLNDEGTNSSAYITPYYGLAANKNSEELIWIREFVNFLFQDENIKNYANEASLIPNSKDAINIASEMYGLDKDKDVTLCGQIRFSDEYNGYSPISVALKNTLKCNAQKYMIDLNKDSSGNIQYETDDAGQEILYLGNGETTVLKKYIGEEDAAKPGFAFCTLDYFVDGLGENISTYKVE